MNAGIFFGILVGNMTRIVGRAIVNKEYFKILMSLGDNGIETSGKILGDIVDWDDDRDFIGSSFTHIIIITCVINKGLWYNVGIMKEWGKKIAYFVGANKFLLRPFLVMLVMYLVGALAIILAGVHYADDIARTSFGYAGWTGFSRYFSTIAAFGLHADGYLTNIYPLPQLLAIVLLAVASIMLICIVSGKRIFKEKPTKWIWRLIAVLPLGLSPYMLECLAYQYDAPYMAVSVLAAVMPLLFRDCKKWIYGLAIFVGVIIVCTSYQAAAGILPMLVVMVAVKKWNEGAGGEKWKGLKFMTFSAVIFVVSILFFQLVLMKPRDAYASNSLPELQNIIPVFFEHLGFYFNLVFSDMKIWWLVIMGIIGLGFLVLFVMRSKKNKVLASVVAVLTLAFVFVMAFAFYAVLEKPLYATRAMYPFGAALAIIGVYVVDGKELLAKGMRAPVVVLSWCFLVFALTFGNVLKEQNEYRSTMSSMVVSELNRLPIMQDGVAKHIQVTGNLGYAPSVRNIPQNYKIIERLLMPSFSEYVPWTNYRVAEISGLPNLIFDETIDLKEKGLPLLKETVFFDIFGDKENILVVFKDTRKFNVVF